MDRLLAAGALVRLHRGVFAVGHPTLPPLGAETAALLACGSGAVLSHRTAAAVWDLVDWPPSPVDVTVVGGHARNHPGIRFHRTKALDRSEIRIRDGLPVTDPERTLLDLAAIASRRELEAAVDRGRAKRKLRENRMRELVDRWPRRRGAGVLRQTLALPGFSRSEAERMLLEIVRRAGLPRPERNVRIAGHEVDLLWRDERLVVEVDGFEYHGDRDAFERDRRRDAELVAAGYRVVRITWRQLAAEPEAVALRLGRALWAQAPAG